MRAIWSGTIGFGLVNIPVKMYSAVQESELDLDLLDEKDHARIKYKRVNENTGKEVAYENIVKGYKLEDGYVILSDKDFELASPKKTKMIEITNFFQEDELDSMYYDRPYYIVPDKAGIKAYYLLYDALKKSKRAALGNFVLRSKEYLCALLPKENVIVVNTLRFDEEIRKINELDIPKIPKNKPAELKMAMTLIDQLSGKFTVSKYKDTYSAELLKLIKTKAKGEKIKPPAMKVTHRKPKDLMAQLKASIEEHKHKRAS